ncbi:MAG: hypothetical protein ABIO78_02385, partial [Thermoanaerobaculia bacterium]
MTRRTLSLAALLLFVASSLPARVISYSPYTDRAAVPLHQSRMNRHFVLVESSGGSSLSPVFAPIPQNVSAQVVVYDFLGEEEPRVAFPTGVFDPSAYVAITAGAVRENSRGVPSILIQAWSSIPNGSVNAFHLTLDGGVTWKRLPIEIDGGYGLAAFDVGGPFAASRYSSIRTGTESSPFVVATRKNVYAIGSDGSTRVLFVASPQSVARILLAGGNAAGTEFLISVDGQLRLIDLDGRSRPLDSPPAGLQHSAYEGWVTSDGS